MRFCPFCSAENVDEQTTCAACSRRLPPLPPRHRNAPPTGVQLPLRTPTLPPPRRSVITAPPPIPAAEPAVATTKPLPIASVRPASTTQPPPLPRSSGTIPPIPRVGSTTKPPPITRSSAAIVLPPTDDQVAVARTSSSNIAPLQPGIMVSPGAQQARPGSHAEIGPPPARELPEPPRPPLPPPVVPPSAFGNDDFNTMAEAKAYDPVTVASGQDRSGATPPPTRIQAAERPFQPPKVAPVPEIPEPGLYRSARYSLRFWQARWQRRRAIRTLQLEIKADTDALDQVLGALGKVARQARIESKVFSGENTAIDKAEERMGVLAREHGDVDGRKAEENSKFVDIEREKTTRLVEAERLVDEHAKEHATLEAERRAARDKRKELERRQKAHLKAAEDNDKQSTGAQMGDQRADLRRSAEQFRRDAAALEPDRQEVDRRLAALEKPINEATTKLDTSKAELETAKRSLADAREGHNHRLAELDAEQKRKAREIAMAESEIARRLVTLGTLVNLNRIDQPVFGELYERIDRLRSAITARTTEIEKLLAEREAYDRGTLVRGISAIVGAIVAMIALIVILRAIF